MRDMRAMMFALSSSVSYESDEGGNVFPAVGKDNEAGIIICGFHTVGIAVRKSRSCVLPRFLAGNIPFVCWHRFQYLSWSATRSLSAPCWRNSFSSAVLSSRAIAEGVLQLRYTASKLECMPSSVSERLKESILNRWI